MCPPEKTNNSAGVVRPARCLLQSQGFLCPIRRSFPTKLLIFLSLPPPPARHPPSISGLELRLPLMPGKCSTPELHTAPAPQMPIFSLLSCPGSKIYGNRLHTMHSTDSNDRTNDDSRQITHHDHRRAQFKINKISTSQMWPHQPRVSAS